MKKSVRALRLAVLAALPLLWLGAAQVAQAADNAAADKPNAQPAASEAPSLTYASNGRWGAVNGMAGSAPTAADLNTSTGFFQQVASDKAWSGPIFYAALGGQFTLDKALFTNPGKLNFAPIMASAPGLAFYLPSDEIAYFSEGACTGLMNTGVCAQQSQAPSNINVSVPALYVLMPQDSKTDPSTTGVKNYGQFGQIALAQQGGMVNLGDTYVNVALPNYLAIKAAEEKAGKPVQYTPSDVMDAWKAANNTSSTLSAGNGGAINVVGKLVTYSNLVPFVTKSKDSLMPKDFTPVAKPAEGSSSGSESSSGSSAAQPVGGTTTPTEGPLANYNYNSGVSTQTAVGGISFSTHSTGSLSGICSTSCTFSSDDKADKPGVINLVLSEGSEFALHKSSTVTNLVMQGTTLYMSDIASAQKYIEFLNNFKNGGKAGAPKVDSASFDYGAGGSASNSPVGITGLSTTGYTGVVLRVEGDYISRGGNTIVFNTYDGNPASTDTLIITGHVKGATKVRINNLKPGAKGLSDLSTKPLIAVKGDDTPNGVNSDASHLPKAAADEAKAVKDEGSFELADRVTQGPYEYFLIHTKLNDKGAHYDVWSLSNRNGSLTPEVGAYLNVLSNANRLFLHGIQDRAATSATPFMYRVWGNINGQQNSWESDDGQLNAKNNSARVLLGGDLYVSNTGEYVLHFGGFWGYGLIKTKAESSRSHYTAKAKTKGYTLGGYSTLYRVDDDGVVSSLELWFQRTHFKTKVDSNGMRFNDFKQSGTSYSVQYSRRFIVHSTQLATERGGVYDQRQWILAPSVQMAYLGNTFDAYKITQKGDTIAPIEGKAGNFMFRADLMLKVDDVQNLVYTQPVISRYVSIGYSHFSLPTEMSYDGDVISASGARNLFNASAGFNARFADVWSADAKVQYSLGRHHYQQLDLNLGLQYAF